jgi:hypothetical protein
MDSGLEGYLAQLLSIRQDLPGVVGGLEDRRFNWTPPPDRWSIGQCVEHLSITAERYIPVLRDAMIAARSKGQLKSGPFALGLFERWFMQAMEPPVRRLRTKTPAAFVAPPSLDPERTLERFYSLHDTLRDCIASADGLDLQAIRVRSQFGPVRWSLNGTFGILLAHARRHIWQAREVRKAPGFPA